MDIPLSIRPQRKPPFAHPRYPFPPANTPSKSSSQPQIDYIYLTFMPPNLLAHRLVKPEMNSTWQARFSAIRMSLVAHKTAAEQQQNRPSRRGRGRSAAPGKTATVVEESETSTPPRRSRRLGPVCVVSEHGTCLLCERFIRNDDGYMIQCM